MKETAGEVEDACERGGAVVVSQGLESQIIVSYSAMRLSDARPASICGLGAGAAFYRVSYSTRPTLDKLNWVPFKAHEHEIYLSY